MRAIHVKSGSALGDDGTSRMALDAATIVVVLAAAAWGWRTAAASREYHVALQLADPHADRTIIRDRLVGTKVSLPGLTRAVENRLNDDADLVWIVDTDRCAACFGRGLARWNALGADPSRHVFDNTCEGDVCYSALEACCLDETVVVVPR